MKKKLLIFTAILSGILIQGCTQESEDIWIDVRSQEEYDTGHLENVWHIPHEQIAERILEVTDNKDATIHLYCSSGGRAGRAKAALEELGFVNIINEGGYEDILKNRASEQTLPN